MPDFFEQMCKVIADSGTQNTGIAADSPDTVKFFSDIRKVPAEPPKREPLPLPETAIGKIPATPAAVYATNSVGSATLEDICRAVHSCCNCPLGKTRKNPVPGEGNPNARLMFIGEGPGADEDAQGRPFVGKAGMLLNKMISAMQFTREEVYITNIVKCRPPDNRIPSPEEAQCCMAYLHRQIELIRPEVIVLLGATAAKYLLNVTSGISRLRGRWLSYENIPVMATFHPAFLLRQESAKRDTWNDLQQVMARFGKYHKTGNSGVKHG